MSGLLHPPTETRRIEHGVSDREVVTALTVPVIDRRRSSYVKAMDRATWAFALVSVAAVATFDDDGIASDVCLVAGGVANTPLRLGPAEAAVEGRHPADAAERAAEAADDGATALSRNGYKLPILRELIRRRAEPAPPGHRRREPLPLRRRLARAPPPIQCCSSYSDRRRARPRRRAGGAAAEVRPALRQPGVPRARRRSPAWPAPPRPPGSSRCSPSTSCGPPSTTASTRTRPPPPPRRTRHRPARPGLHLMAHVAAHTTTLRLLTGVLVLPQRNPLLVAKQVATLDALSGAASSQGIGVGWLRRSSRPPACLLRGARCPYR
ncbi:MAG: LLM class flavin-dependent oxidoreductase [Acidimicrobiales bacterium]